MVRAAATEEVNSISGSATELLCDVGQITSHFPEMTINLMFLIFWYLYKGTELSYRTLIAAIDVDSNCIHIHIKIDKNCTDNERNAI